MYELGTAFASFSRLSFLVNFDLQGRSPFYAVSVNCLYRDRVRVNCRVTDTVMFRVRFRIRRPDSSGNLLIRRKVDYARFVIYRTTFHKVVTGSLYLSVTPKFYTKQPV